MGRIRILSDIVANKIAAGEVVERPASVVKEMLENSLDAGAMELRVDIESGGRRLIRITDDGVGMLRDDALLAFERHATSKLSDVKDLESIATLGFRGEALPSIASVSRLTLETRSRDEQTGTRVEIAGGKLLRCDEAALAPGTVITVRDLFFNVPARKKFLRSEQTELAHVTSLAMHYSLAHPDKWFLLRNGPHELLNVTPVETLRERVFQVFGTEALDELIDLGARESEFILPTVSLPPWASPAALAEAAEETEEDRTRAFLLRGFVSRPQVHKTNRNSIFLFVNGRLIRDKLLLHALASAYYNLMPSSAFPFALLFLDCDAGEVDVNVHPSKVEVRFRHSTFVHDFVRDSIRAALTESRPASAFPQRISPPPRPAPGAQAAAQLPYSEFSQHMENFGYTQSADRGVPDQEWAPAPHAAQANEDVIDNGVSALRMPPPSFPEVILRPPPGPAPRLSFGDPEPAESAVAPPRARLPIPDTHTGFPEGAVLDAPLDMSAFSDLRPLGQLHDSFIIAAGRDGLWIVDQHVAHERILFEQVLKQRAQGTVESQQLLMPVVIGLTPAQQIEYARIAGELNATGFDTEPFGNRTLAVKAAPAGLGAAELERVLGEILEISDEQFRTHSLDGVSRAIAASVACRAAIKINTRLDDTRMRWLLRTLAATEYPMSCPHGRPVALRYSMRDILRAFHRV